MKKQWVISLLASSIFLLTQPANAADLMQVYQQALNSDPVFKAAYSTEMAEAEAVPTMASALLPQVAFTGGANWGKTTIDSDNYAAAAAHTGAGFRTTLRRKTTDVGLNVTQSIFDLTNWLNLAAAQASVKAAKATYNSAALDLMTRTAQAYFAVLESQDMLRFTIAEKQALYEEYLQAKERMTVGVATITDVENAKAAYEQANADYITAKNDVSNKNEALRIITGIIYPELSVLKPVFPLISPDPMNIDRWVSVGLQQNWDFAAARYTTLAAKRDITAAEGGHLPTVTATAGYDNQLVRTYGGRGRTRTKGPSAEIDFSLPIYSGGSVNAAVKTAIANYETASNNEEQAYRQVVSDTRMDYLGVLSNISTVTAQQQVVKSNLTALNATKAGYRVGTQTMVDVLLAQKAYFQSQKNYAAARYNYIISLLKLKKDTGVLSVNDLQEINTWCQSGTLLPATVVTTVAEKQNVTEKRVVKKAAATKITGPMKTVASTTAVPTKTIYINSIGSDAK